MYSLSLVLQTWAVWIQRSPQKRRQFFSLALVLALMLQFMPLDLPIPSQVVSRLLIPPSAVLPAWINPDTAAVAEALAPLDRVVESLEPGLAHAKEIQPTTLQFTKVCDPNPVGQGGLITYTLYITNTGAITASILITDPYPTNTTYASILPGSDGGATWSSTALTDYVRFYTGDFFDIPGDKGLAPGRTAIQRFQVRVAKPFTDQATITNTAFLTANLVSPLAASCIVTVNAPVFAIGKTPASSTVEAGETLTYTLYITNTGHLTATLLFTVTDRVPDAMHYLSSSPAGSYSEPDRTVTWVLTDDLGVGQAVTTSLVVTVTTPYTNGVILTNSSYRVWSDEVLAAAEGDPVTVTVTSHPHLALTKVDAVDPVQAGDYLTYTLTLENQSGANGHAQNVAVTDTVPLSATFAGCSGAPCAESGGVVTWTLPAGDELIVGQSAQFTLTVRVHSPLISGTLLTNASYGVTATNAASPTAGAAVTTTVNSSPSLTVTKSVDPDSVMAGEIVTYTIELVNDGNETATGVSITDTLPVSFTFGGLVSGPAPSGASTRTITWTDQTVTGTVIGRSITPGPLTLIFTATVDAAIPDGTVHTNLVTAAYRLGEITTGPTAPVTVTSPLLDIAKSPHAAQVDAGERLTYTIRYSNTNSTPATSVVITDRLPAHVSFVGASGDFAGYQPVIPAAGEVMTFTIGGLAQADGQQSIALVLSVSSPLTDGTVLTNQARISAAEPSVADTGPVTVVVRSAPSLSLQKTDSPDPVEAGAALGYVLTATNAALANALAAGVTITDVVPQHTTFVAAATAGLTFEGPDANDVITWTLASALAPGDSAVVTFTVAVDSPLPDGAVLTNTGWLTCAQGVGAAATATTTVQSRPALTLTKQDAPDPAAVGGALYYTLTATNLASANAAATSVVLTDALPADVTFTGASPGYTGPDAQGVITWTLPDLNPGDSQAITLTTLVNTDLADETTLTNCAWITSAQGVGAAATETTTVRAPDLTVSKSATPAIARPGETITYVIVFSNSGGIAASGVRLTDTLPLSVSLVTSQTTSASYVPGSSFAWYSDTVEAGSVGVITLTAQVTTTPGWIDADGGTAIENSVVITGATPDGDPSNNRTTAQTTVYAGLPATLTLSAAPTTTTVDGSSTITAAVTDAWGNPVMNQDNVTVTLGSSLAGSQITPPTATLLLGQATASITSTATGLALVSGAIGANPTVTDTATVTFAAGALHHLAFGPLADQTAGVDFTINITACDRYSNVVDYDGVVTLADPSTGSLRPVTSDNFVNGILSSQAVSITQARANQPMRAVTAAVTSNSDPFTVTASAATTLTLSAAPSTVGVGVNADLTAALVDAFDNPVAATTITFTAANLGGGSIDPAAAATDAAGEATAIISSTVLGSRLITAATGSLTATTWITFTAGPPAVITLTITSSTTVVGSAAQMTTTVADAYGNPVSDEDMAFNTDDDLGGGAISPATDTTDAGGQATSAISSTASGVKTVVAEATNGITGTAQVTFTAGALDHFAVGPVADPQTAGVAFTLVVTAQDSFSNTVLGFTGQVTLTDSTGTLLPGVSGGFVDGVRSESATITLAQTGVTIAVTHTAGTEAGLSNTFGVVANAPATVTLQVAPVNVPLQGAAALTATVTDAWSNPVTDGTPVTFTTSAGSVVPSPAATTDGAATAQLTADCVERTGVMVMVMAGLVFDTATISFTAPGAPMALSVTAAPGSIPVGSGTAVVTATAVDCAANPVPGQVVSFAASLGSLPASGATDASGLVTATLTAGTTAGTAAITATLGSLSDTTSVVIEPGAPATVTVTANPASIPANGHATSTVTTHVTDVYGNPVADGANGTLDYHPTALGSLAPLTFTTTAGSGAAIFTADVLTGTVTLTATVDGISGATQLTLTPGITELYLPMAMRQYAPPPRYDLLVESVTWSPSPPTAGQPYHVEIVVRNDGTLTVTNDFWVDLYLNPRATPGVNQTWDMLSRSSYGKAWLVRDDIGPGMTVTLSTADPDDPLHPGDRYSYWPPPPYDAAQNPFYVLVDSWGQSVGLVDEGNAEGNNLWGPVDASAVGAVEAKSLNGLPGPSGPPSGPRPQLLRRGGWSPWWRWRM
ncbi:MAG: Ig-like domain-containing protein [Chloroflexota bacterium]